MNNREVYEGDWVKGKEQGTAKFVFSNGDIYIGITFALSSSLYFIKK
jgi:hypothetical protein